MKSFEFHKYSRFISIHGNFKAGWSGSFCRMPSSYVFKVDLGLGSWKGAGYIHGITFFFARNSGSARWAKQHRGKSDRHTPFGFEIGWTRNGNRVPYVSH
jgi:hypothetical protein